jgi:hypothetical protein
VFSSSNLWSRFRHLNGRSVSALIWTCTWKHIWR